MDIGSITFGTLLPDPATGRRLSQRERLTQVIDGAVLAEQLGFAWYALGEHHFTERDVIASPQVVLGAIAERTSTITLATGTTLVANRDPVLVAEDYATVDLLCDGRLRMIAGASFFEEPYAVFGQAQDSRAARKRENLELLLRLWTEETVTWQGEFRPPLDAVRVQPRLFQSETPVWVSGGWQPDSGYRVAALGSDERGQTGLRLPGRRAQAADGVRHDRADAREPHAGVRDLPPGLGRTRAAAGAGQNRRGQSRLRRGDDGAGTIALARVLRELLPRREHAGGSTPRSVRLRRADRAGHGDLRQPGPGGGQARPAARAVAARPAPALDRHRRHPLSPRRPGDGTRGRRGDPAGRLPRFDRGAGGFHGGDRRCLTPECARSRRPGRPSRWQRSCRTAGRTPLWSGPTPTPSTCSSAPTRAARSTATSSVTPGSRS